MDDTRIETAPTPAHVFAYRAFRSVFVGSPESSPVRPPPEVKHPDDNKENARRSPAKASRFIISPTRSKRDAEFAAEKLSLTPKRQRTNPVSPTKSILKNPNVLTPRRASLRDVTVTFKDVRLSTSPKAARHVSPTRVRSQPDLCNTLTSLSLAAPPRSMSTSQAETSRKKNEAETRLQPAVDFDLDAYRAQTEREMRRLIKYGQKWREYAMKQDDENARLRALLEEVQMENRRLKQNNDKSAQEVRSPDLMKAQQHQARRVLEAKLPKHRIQAHDTSSQTHQPKPERWKLPLEHAGPQRPHSKSKSTDKEKSPEAAGSTRHDRGQDEQQRHRPTKTHTKENAPRGVSEHEHEHGVDSTRYRSEQTDPTARSREPPVADRDGGRGRSDEARVQVRPDKSGIESLTEEERKAAARERLRLKREAKGANGRAPSARRKPLEPPGADVEESQVDWMAVI